MQDSAAQGSLLSVLAQETEHFSGSDLYELCAEAASIPLYEDTTAQPQCALLHTLPHSMLNQVQQSASVRVPWGLEAASIPLYEDTAAQPQCVLSHCAVLPHIMLSQEQPPASLSVAHTGKVLPARHSLRHSVSDCVS